MGSKSLKKIDIIILGAGISGLSLGYYLNKRDKDFLIFESNSVIGGNIFSKSKDGFIFENGPNTVLLNNSILEKLISELGLEKAIIYPNKNNNKRFLIKNGKLISIPLTVIQFLKSNILNFCSKFRVLLEIFKKKSEKNVSVYDFFNRRFGKEFHDILIEPFLTGVYAGDTKNMSIKHVLNKVWKIEQYNGSVILGLIKQKSKKNTPKSFNFKNGLRELTNSIYSNFSDKIMLKSKITLITKKNNLYEISVNGKLKYQCNKLVSTIPAYTLADIIFDNKLSVALKKIFYCPIYVLHLGLEKQKIKENIGGFGVLTKPSDNKSFLGIIFNSRIFPHVAPENQDLITVMAGGVRQSDLVKLGSRKLYDKILRDVKQLISYEGKILMKNDYLWEKGIPQYSLNHDSLIKDVNFFQKRNKNFHLIGNYIKGISVSDCILNAYNLSEKL